MRRYFFLFILLSEIPLFAQITFQKTYRHNGGDFQVFSTCATSDGGYAMAGYAATPNGQMALVKLDCEGEEEWVRTYGPGSTVNNTNPSVIQAGNGDIILAHSTGDFFLNNMDLVVLSVSPNGDLNWKKNLGGSRNDIARGIAESPDGTLVITGGTSSYGSDAGSNTYSDAFLIKLDGLGNLLWSQTYGNNGNTDDGFAVCIDPSNGEIYMTGRYIVNGTFFTYILKTDEDGNVIWFRAYGKDNHRNYGFAIALDNDGHAVIAGSSTNLRANFNSNADPFLIKADGTTGDTLWTRILEPTDDFSDNASAICLDQDGNYIVSAAVMSYSGFTQGFVPNKHAVYRMNPDGNLEIARILNTGGSHYPFIAKAPGAGFLCSGFTNHYGSVNFEPILARLNTNLESGCNENNVISLTTSVAIPWQIEIPEYETGTGFSSADASGEQSFAFDEILELCSDFPDLTTGFSYSGSCAGEPFQFTSTSVGAIISWEWNFGNGDNATGEMVNYTYPEGGDYTVSLTVSDGCQTVMVSMGVEVGAVPFADAGPDQTINPGGQVQIGGSPTGPPEADYTWIPASDLNNPWIPNPIASPDSTVQYIIETNTPEGCTARDTVTVFVVEPVLYGDIFVPNIFSPNDDQLNDTLLVYGGPFKEMNFQVFDRWGMLVFESRDQKKGWDGKYRGIAAASGVYYYRLEGSTSLGLSVKESGNVSLIK